MIEAAVERAPPACQFVDKQYEALMSSPGPRPAETRVFDDISLIFSASGQGGLETLDGWGIVLLDVTHRFTSSLGSASVDKESLSCSTDGALRRHALFPRSATISISDIDPLALTR